MRSLALGVRVRYPITSIFAGEETGMQRSGSPSQGPRAGERWRQDVHQVGLAPQPWLLTIAHDGFSEIETRNQQKRYSFFLLHSVMLQPGRAAVPVCPALSGLSGCGALGAQAGTHGHTALPRLCKHLGLCPDDRIQSIEFILCADRY